MLSFFPRDVLDEIWDLIESVSEGFPTYFCLTIPPVFITLFFFNVKGTWFLTFFPVYFQFVIKHLQSVRKNIVAQKMKRLN